VEVVETLMGAVEVGARRHCRLLRPLPFPLVSLLLLHDRCTQNDWK
jgi:hypothetical protein